MLLMTGEFARAKRLPIAGERLIAGLKIPTTHALYAVKARDLSTTTSIPIFSLCVMAGK